MEAAERSSPLVRRLSEREVADHFHISTKTLRRWVAEGLIERLKHGRRNVYTVDAVLEAEQRMSGAGDED